MSIFTDSLEKISNGAPFRVDFKKRSLYIGRKCVIRNGECDDTDFPYDFSDIESIYDRYKHSVPTQGTREIFYALSEEELSDDDMMYGIDRHKAEAILVLTILKALIDGTFVWERLVANPDYFFWQAPFDKDLVLYKEMFF